MLSQKSQNASLNTALRYQILKNKMTNKIYISNVNDGGNIK
mgnify:CR=1 FL=1